MIQEHIYNHEEQKLVVQAMSYLHFSAEDLAPCFGLYEDGRPVKTPEQIKAAYDYFRNKHGLLCDPSIWQRDDAKFKPLVKAKIEEARAKQLELRQQVERKASVSTVPLYHVPICCSQGPLRTRMNTSVHFTMSEL